MSDIDEKQSAGWKKYTYSDEERRVQKMQHGTWDAERGAGDKYIWPNHNTIKQNPGETWSNAVGVPWPYMDNVAGYQDWWRNPDNIAPIFQQNYGYNPETQQFPSSLENVPFNIVTGTDDDGIFENKQMVQYSDDYLRNMPIAPKDRWVDGIDKGWNKKVPSVDQTEQMTTIMNQHSAFSDDAEANAMLEAAIQSADNSKFNQD